MLCGGDVHYELPGTLKRLTTAAIRGDTESDASRALHRIILSIVGEPLQWKYKDDLHLLRAFRDIVETHQYLCSVGILHWDISPGTLLLNPSPPKPHEQPSPPMPNVQPPVQAPEREPWGFISDFDMARVDANILGRVVRERIIEPQKRASQPIMPSENAQLSERFL
ncbi:hypothetical protein C8Q72DRAFT_129815 [Fomitopsis betulina]|nr:hypothetical protein C8Q72DRAFT_129815 [Fomitopsis betulina]